MKAAFYTLGCKVNQYETQAMTQQLLSRGYTVVDCDEDADVYIVNSCTVTAESDRKTRQSVRHIKGRHPASIVVLTGCVPQAFPSMCGELFEADIVLGNNSNRLLADKLDEFISSHSRIIATEPHKNGESIDMSTISGFRGKTRANVKIEDGCNRFCSYCIIPYARGRVRSKPLDTLKAELAALADNGYREIVLVGINLSAYGLGTDKTIVDAVRLACSFDSIKRVRLGSLEPDHITDEVIAGLCKLEKFCPQFHISLQSGCTATLRRMNRHYTADEYRELCGKLRSTFPGAAITTDVMVGFPGETQEEFEQSLQFVKEIAFEKVHIFPYSRRDGTPAAKMPGQIPKAVKEQRAKQMSEAAGEIRRVFLCSQIGKTLEILPEEYSKGSTHGYTANYTPVRFDGEIGCGDLTKVTITGVDGDFCTGTVRK